MTIADAPKQTLEPILGNVEVNVRAGLGVCATGRDSVGAARIHPRGVASDPQWRLELESRERRVDTGTIDQSGLPLCSVRHPGLDRSDEVVEGLQRFLTLGSRRCCPA